MPVAFVPAYSAGIDCNSDERLLCIYLTADQSKAMRA